MALNYHYKKYNNGKILLKFHTKTIGTLWLKDQDQPSCYISHFSVLVDYRGQGIGSIMLNDLCQSLICYGKTAVSLYCAISNARALNFYTRHGFFIACTSTDKTLDFATGKKEHHYFMVKKLEVSNNG